MPFPIDPSLTGAGYTGMSGVYIPEIWTGKLIEKFYTTTVFGAIANTDYEGEITAYGDKVYIPLIPDMVIHEYKIGQDLVIDTPQPKGVELVIDKGSYYNFRIDNVEAKQASIQYMEKWSLDGAEQLKIYIDSTILADIPASAGAHNFGATAGKISGNINLGATGAPVILDSDNIVEKIIECGQVLSEQNVPQIGRWMVIPASLSVKIKTSKLADSSYSGDGKSIARDGRLGLIDKFALYESNNILLTNDGSHKCWSVVFGHKSVLTFATQLVENEILPHPTQFGKLIRGLQVYGYEVVKPNGFGHLYAATA